MSRRRSCAATLVPRPRQSCCRHPLTRRSVDQRWVFLFSQRTQIEWPRCRYIPTLRRNDTCLDHLSASRGAFTRAAIQSATSLASPSACRPSARRFARRVRTNVKLDVQSPSALLSVQQAQTVRGATALNAGAFVHLQRAQQAAAIVATASAHSHSAHGNAD